MTKGGEERFEFRVWADRLDALGDLLRSRSEPLGVRESTETYFVSTSAIDANPKARADLLDVKVLVGVREGFEQWDARMKAEFPVSARMLRADLFRLLGLAPPPLERAEYSLMQLVDEVVPSHPDLAAATVTKRRRMYTVNDCIAELTDASIAGRRFQTAAVESVDLGALREARRILGLDDQHNVSYPRAIRSALGGRFAGR